MGGETHSEKESTVKKMICDNNRGGLNDNFSFSSASHCRTGRKGTGGMAGDSQGDTWYYTHSKGHAERDRTKSVLLVTIFKTRATEALLSP